jgi:hypothetical protein
MTRRHSWTQKEGSHYEIDSTRTCVKCGVIRLSSGYNLSRSYHWKGPPQAHWNERAPSCPPDLTTRVVGRNGVFCGPHVASASAEPCP